MMNCVLIIDDDPAVRQLAQIVLQTEGYNVKVASNGVEGLTLLEEAKPSVIVLDLQMPVMDGRTFFKEIDGPERPPVILLSAYGVEDACRELGAEDCISKPYNPFDLMTKVKKVRGDA